MAEPLLAQETVAEYVPALAVRPAAILSTVPPEPGGARAGGVKVAETPAGNPAMVNEIAALNPPLTLTVNVRLLFDAAATLTEPAEEAV